jgi:hypothetical protein
MGLTVAAPLALLASFLLVLPVLAHLSRQVPRDRVPFGAMLLLERVVRRLRRRRRVKDRALLALRLLALLAFLLAAAGLRWTWNGATPTFGGTGEVVLVIDRSMSMGLVDSGSTLLQRARADATAVIRSLPSGTRTHVVAFDDAASVLSPPGLADPDVAATLVATIEQTGGASDLQAALVAARRQLEGRPGEVIVFTDEAGPRLVADAEGEIARLVASGSALMPRPLHADPPRNLAVTDAEYGDGVEGGQVRLRVTNFGPAAVEARCAVTLPDGQKISVFVDVPPEGEAEERITVPREAAGGVGEARCEDPDLPGDDARYFHLPRVGASRVLLVDGDPGDTPIRSEVYFLERALAPWGGARGGVRPEVVSTLGAQAIDPERHRVVFLANVADPRPYGPRLTDFVRRGGALVLAMGDNLTPERYNAAFSSILPAQFRRARALAAAGEEGVPLAPAMDPVHGLLEPFSRGGRASLARVRTRKVMTLDPYDEGGDVSTILSFEGGVPALVERRVGKGRVMVWTATMDLGWTNLPLQTSFVPMIQRIVTWLGAETGDQASRVDGVVGAPVRVALPDLALDLQVVGPNGDVVRSRVEDGALWFTPPAPGAYQVQPDSAPTAVWVAVNTPAQESDVRRYGSLAAADAAVAPHLFERHVELGPWLLLVCVGLLVAQAVLAVRSAQTVAAEHEA